MKKYSIVNIGEKIRKIRESKGLSRQAFCNFEIDLTIKQLSRIEKGDSFPNIITLSEIANRLAVPLSLLIDDENADYSPRYIELKYSLIKLSHYNDPKRIDKQTAIFDEIYQDFYSNLSEEEQVGIDALKMSMKVHFKGDINFGEGILNTYFSKIKDKDNYSETDLFIISLYFHCYYYHPYETETFELFLTRLIIQAEVAVGLKAIIINQLLLLTSTIFTKNKQYHRLFEVINASSIIMENNDDFQKKPIVIMLEGKYLLLSKGYKDKAKEKYEKAAELADFFGNNYLSKKIMEEWKKDLNEYNFLFTNEYF